MPQRPGSSLDTEIDAFMQSLSSPAATRTAAKPSSLDSEIDGLLSSLSAPKPRPTYASMADKVKVPAQVPIMGTAGVAAAQPPRTSINDIVEAKKAGTPLPPAPTPVTPPATGETTALSPADEARFQRWAAASGIPDVDHPDSHYDYRGLFLATGGRPVPQTPDRHFPDTFKQHGHPTFSRESKYSTGPSDGGTWTGDRFNPTFPGAQPSDALVAAAAQPPQPTTPPVTRPRVPMESNLGVPIETPEMGTVPVLDAPHVGYEQAATGAQHILEAARDTSQPPPPASTRLGSAKTGGMARMAPIDPRLLTGAAEVLEGGMKATEPLLAGALLASPAGTAAALAKGAAAGVATQKALDAAGASPEASRLVADIVGAVAAGVPLKETIDRAIWSVADKTRTMADAAEAKRQAARTITPDPSDIPITPERQRLPQEAPLGTPIAPQEPRPPQGPTTSTPPVAVRPGGESVGPVAPSPVPSPDAVAAVPAASTLDQEIAQTIAQAAGPEFVPVGSEATPASQPAPTPTEHVLDRVAGKLANGEKLGTDEGRRAVAERQRVDEARPDEPPRTLDQEIAQTIAAAEPAPSLDTEIDQAIAAAARGDVLDTGEVQSRLPGAEGARQVGKADVTFKAPQQASGDDFSLTREETPESRALREETERAPQLFNLAPETTEGYDAINDHERRELRRMQAEMESMPFVKHSFVDDIVGRGGAAEIVPGAAGAPVFDDIKGGTRQQVINAIARVLDGKKPTAVGQRAIDAARHRMANTGHAAPPKLPPDAGDEPGKVYVPMTPDMTAEELAVEQPFRRRVERHTGEVVAEYVRRFGNIVDADKAKELSPEYAASLETRAQFNRAVHRASSALAGAVYRHLVEQPTPDGKDPVVDFIAGPTGAGKSTVRDALSQALARSQVVVDGPLTTLPNAQQRIQFALDHGKRVAITYVHRDPVDAWRGVLGRARKEGRLPPVDYHIKSHVEGLRTIKQLVDTYADEPQVEFAFVRSESGEPVTDISAHELPEAYNETDVRAAIEQLGATEEAGGPKESGTDRALAAREAGGDRRAQSRVGGVSPDPSGRVSGSAPEDVAPPKAPKPATPVSPRKPSTPVTPAEPPREFSSTQVDLPKAVRDRMQQLAAEIPDTDLGKDGREEHPHVTVKFGLHTNDAADVRRVLAGERPITVTLGKTSIFPAKEGADYDVVKVDVDSPDLHRLNAKLAGALEHTDTHPTYAPHVTLAYVKSGLGEKYVGRTDLQGQEMVIRSITFSGKDRQLVTIPLTGSSASKSATPVTPTKFANSSTAAPRGGRTPVTLQVAVVPGAKEFIEQDVAPRVAEAGRQLDEARKDVRALFAPDTVGEGSRVFADILRAGLAAHAQRVQRAQHVLRAMEKAFDRRSNDENLAFMDAIESGQIDVLPEQLRAPARQLRELLTNKRGEVRKRGKLQSYIENYFPHEWKQPTKAKDLIRRILGRRPLQGPKTFLKKRSIPTVAEGVALGLEPASYNPVTLVLHKLAEMDKWIMAHDVLKESKSLGVAKFVRAGAKPPDGWQRYHDSFGTVYAPPFVKVDEAYDARLMEKLHEFATALGITAVRKVKIAQKGSGVGSAAWGYAIANPDGSQARVATKFAGPETVLEHEIGHVLDWKYGLWDKISRELDDEQFDASERHPARELRDLADRRFEGESDVKPSFRTYVRKKEEKIANLVHAFIYNPALAKEVAPNAYWALYNLAKDNPELAPLIELQKTKSLVLGTNTTEQRVNGTVIAGHYYGPPDATRILNNYLSPGLRGNAAFDAYRTAGNFLNQVQLGLSGFHLTMTGIEAMVSKLAQGIEELARGEFAHAGKTIAEAPVATVTTLFKGNRALKELYARDANLRSIAGVADLVAQAGGGINRDKTMRAYEDRVEAMLKALRQGNVIGAAARLPAALFELPTKFVMEWWVPRLKLGAFLDMARMELRTLGPEPSLADVRRVLGGVQDSIDNRFGQLVYDNLFWHNALKDAGMGAVRALGWNVGTIREVFGAPTGQAKHLLNRPTRLRDTGLRGEGDTPVYTREKDPWLTHKAAYVVALAVGIGLISAIYEYLHTGERPKELRDLAFPRTGGKRPDGKDERVSFPSYFKDVYAFFHDLPTSATETVGHKLQPLLNLLYETWSNEDYYGTEIRNADDPLVQQLQDYVTFLAEQVKPISLRSFDQRKQDRGETGISGVESFFGVTPAPASVYRSRAEEQMRKYLPQHGLTKREANASQTKRDLKEAVRNDDRAATTTALATGELSRRQVEDAVRTARLTPLQAGFQHLTLDQALKVWGVATPEERASVRPLLQRKAESALQSAPPADLPALVQRVRAAFAMPVGAGSPVTPRPAPSAGRTPVTAR